MPWDIERGCELFERRHRRHGLAILHAREITALQALLLLNIAL